MESALEATTVIVEIEKAALERWGQGDPSGFLEISADDVVYFDPYVERRIDGLAALTAYYKSFWGQVHVDGFELLNPKVQQTGDMAVLTFNYVSWVGEKRTYWNCTEVYRQSESSWRIIQTHWSYTEAGKALA